MGIRSLSTASISTGTKRSKVWDQSAVVITNSFESIATVNVGSGGSSSVTFSSIPSTYKHLQIRAINRSTRASSFGYFNMSFNSDVTNANYFWGHNLAGSGTSAYADTFGSAPGIVIQQPGGTQSGSMFGATTIDILDYSNTNKNKTARIFNGHDFNGTGYVIFQSGLWMSTAAVSSITLTDQHANLAQYSSFALYGIRG